MSAGRRRFRIIKEIAEGGFGKVYLAEQISSDGFSRIVAVKLLHAKWSSHDEVVMRTRDEARLLGLIRHQHIVKVEDLTALDGKCAIVMEYLEGCDLKWMISFLQERSLEFPRAALFEIVLAVASALDAAYNGIPLQGGDPLRVIHRDIKPSNVFVTIAGGVKVLDFGTARANFAEREAKTQALAFGSQGYMAPERMLGEEDTPAADVFSLGIALYEVLALESFGRIPPRPTKFAAKVEERVRSIPLTGDPEWCDQVRDTLRLMLSYEPADRPSAAQLVELMEFLAQDAADMGLRRFCRTLVAEAKAQLPDMAEGDPLAGRIVEEDASFAGEAGSQTFYDEDEGAGEPATEHMSADQISAVLQSQSGQSVSPVHTTKAEPVGAMSKVPVEVEEGGFNLVKVAGGLGAVLAFFVVVGLFVAAAIVAVVMFGGDDSTGVPDPAPTAVQPVPTPGSDTPPGPATDPTPTPAPAASGLKELKKGAGGVKVKLELPAGSAANSIKVRGPDSTYDWNGAEPAELDLKPGRYRTIVGGDGIKSVRPSFEVEAGKACTYMLDLEGSSWKMDCP